VHRAPRGASVLAHLIREGAMNYPAYRPYPSSATPGAHIAAETAAFMRKVYAFMAGGLLATGVTALLVASSPAALRLIVGNRIIFYGLLFGELALVWGFASIARRVSAAAAGAVFLLYSVLNGLTLSVIFLAYTRSSIATTFFVTAGTFGVMSVYGLVTRRDLTGVGNFMMMGLIGLIIASLVNIFLQSPAITWVTTCMGVLIFVGLTAYDTQKIKELSLGGSMTGEEGNKGAIHGALVLYLDFINLFLFLLRLLGGSDRRR
jgi:FtsH-binding integral membrane protein